MGCKRVEKVIESVMGGSSGTAMVSLVNEIEEGRLEGLNSKEVQEVNLSGDEINCSSFGIDGFA
jgi:hypothetical protein